MKNVNIKTENSKNNKENNSSSFNFVLPFFILIFTFFIMLPASADAANRYWVGAAVGCDGTWADTDCWASTSNGAGAAGVPTSADDVFFDGVGNGASNSTLGASITINSLDMTGYANTLTHAASVTLTVDGNGVVFKFSAGMTYTASGVTTSHVTFTGTSGDTLITSAGKVFGGIVTFNGVGGTWTLQDAFSNTASMFNSLILAAGTLNTNDQTVSVGIFNSSGTSVRALNLGASTINIARDNNYGWAFSTVTNLTFNAGTSNIILETTACFQGGGLTYNNVTIVSTGICAAAIEGANTFANLTLTGGATKTDGIAIAANQTITGTLTINGNSSVNRLIVYSSTLGTSRTLTAAAVSATNADFRDITGAGAASWNLSAITGLSGDAGGNSGITFTSAQTQYWVGAAGSWSTAAEWGTSSGGSAGRVPLPQDDVVFDNNSFSGAQTVTMDMPRAGKSIDFSAYNEGQTPIFSPSLAYSIYGSLTLNSGISFTTGAPTFEGRGSFTLTTAGKTFNSTLGISMFGGTLTLQDAITINGNFTLSNGTFNANNFNVTTAVFILTGSNTRTLTMGSGTWTITWTSGTIWSSATVTGLTFNKDTATILISDKASGAKTFAGGGLTYNNVIFSGDNITVTGSNTFNQFKVNTSGMATGLILTAGTTQTVTAFSTDASLGRVAKLLSSSAGSAATISQASGMVCSEYMSIKDSTATGGASWYAGNSTSVSGNTGWTFSQCPSPNTGTRAASPTGPANVKISSTAAVGGAPGWYNTLWSYRRPIVVDRTRVATTSALTNFPLLISVIDPDLRSTGNGGKVASTTGGDLVFTSSNGTTLLDFEIEKYTPTTGELIAWVRIPSLSGVTDTKIFMYLGNTVITVPLANPTGVWDANYLAVWHLRDGTTLSGLDSTSNGNNGTVQGSMSAGVGKIDGGASNNTDSSKYISGSGINLSGSEFTVEAWQKPSGAYSSTIFSLGSVGSTRKALHVRAQTNTTTLLGLYSDDLTGTVSPQSNVFNYTVATMDSSFVQTLYQNGAYVNSRTAGAMFSGNTDWKIGQQSWDTGSTYGGIIDEVRVSNIVRGSDWIATTYNNHSNPANFYSYQGLENMNGRVNSSGISVPFLKIRGGVKFR